MKGLGETSPFHLFTNPRRDKSVYFWSWGSYLLRSELRLFLTILGLISPSENGLNAASLSNITPRTFTRQTKTDDVKLKQMTSLTGLDLHYFARDVN